MGERMLFRSCAMPLASVPMLSRRCARRNCDSSFFVSVMSVLMTSTDFGLAVVVAHQRPAAVDDDLAPVLAAGAEAGRSKSRFSSSSISRFDSFRILDKELDGLRADHFLRTSSRRAARRRGSRRARVVEIADDDGVGGEIEQIAPARGCAPRRGAARCGRASARAPPRARQRESRATCSRRGASRRPCACAATAALGAVAPRSPPVAASVPRRLSSGVGDLVHRHGQEFLARIAVLAAPPHRSPRERPASVASTTHIGSGC